MLYTYLLKLFIKKFLRPQQRDHNLITKRSSTIKADFIIN